MCDIFHAKRHDGAIEIGAQADVIDASDFHGMIDVLDDFGPIDFGEFAFAHEIANDLLADEIGAGFVFATALFDFGVEIVVNFGVGGFEVVDIPG